MEMYSISFFMTDKDDNPIDLVAKGDFDGKNWPVTLKIGTNFERDAICFHMATVEQLEKFQASLNKAVEKVKEIAAEKEVRNQEKIIGDVHLIDDCRESKAR